MTLWFRHNIAVSFIVLLILVLLVVIIVNILPGGNRTNQAKSNEPPTIPADFPDDFPIFEGKLKQSKWTLNGFGQKLYLINVEIGKPIESVAEFYQATLPAKGWIVDGPHERQPGVTDYNLIRPSEQSERDAGKSSLRLIANKDGSKTFLKAAVRIKE